MSEESANYFSNGGKGRRREKEWLTKRTQLHQQSVASRETYVPVSSARKWTKSNLCDQATQRTRPASLARKRTAKCGFSLESYSAVHPALKEAGWFAFRMKQGREVRAQPSRPSTAWSRFDHFQESARARYNELTNRENQLDKEVSELQRRVTLWKRAGTRKSYGNIRRNDRIVTGC